jgi:hypothetical protein
VHSQPAPPAARLAGFERLHAEGRRAVLAGTHQVECVPANGGPRWAAGAVLRPDRRAARAIEQVARTAAAVVGAGHWLAGAARSSHLSLRRHLEPRRRPIWAGDRLVARYAAALRAAAKSSGPVRFAVAGLILTPVSVMARAIPADAAADDLATIFDAALHAGGCHQAGSPVLWYVNLVYFTGPVQGPDELAAWTEARQQMKVTDVRVTEMQIVRWQYTTTGMMPVALASASLRWASTARGDSQADQADQRARVRRQCGHTRQAKVQSGLPGGVRPGRAGLRHWVSYSSWRRHQIPVSLRPRGARSSHGYIPHSTSIPRS